MIFTVDTYKKLVTVTSSVKYEEVKELREKFPSEFLDNYTWLVPFDLIDTTTIDERTPKQIEQPEYPIACCEDGCTCRE